MKITSFEKQTFTFLRAEIDAALNAVAAKHGITLKIGNISFDAGKFSTKLEGKCEASGDQEQKMAIQMARLYDIDATKTYTKADGTTMTIVRFDSKKRKMPWILRAQDGKMYQISDEEAKRRFPMSEKTNALSNMIQGK